MKKNLLLLSLFTLTFCCSATFAINIDSQIEDELNKKAEEEMISNAQDLNEKITFTKVESCKSMESVMNDFLETYKKLNPRQNRHWYDYPVYYKSATNWISVDYAMDEVMMVQEAGVESMTTNSTARSSDMWEIADYSTTNIQKVWVDEPEILKSNGNYLFYYAEPSYNEKYISIIKTPRQTD